MNAKEIQRRLIKEHFFGPHFIMPSYTPKGWFECDLFMVTAHGYFVEFEIKVSRQDFFKDASKKHRTTWRNVAAHGEPVAWRESQVQNKHLLLAARKLPAPSRFWFVMPAELAISSAEVPEFAGVIYVESGEAWQRHRLIEHKKAPQLHREKIDPSIVENARKNCYYRMHKLILKG